MANSKTKQSWLDRKQNLLINTLIIGTILWIILAPILLTQFNLVDFRATGQIGDTLGGITAPAIGLLSAFLVYFSFKAQIKANEQINKQIKRDSEIANFSYLNNEFLSLKNSINHYTYKGRIGFDAVLIFITDFDFYYEESMRIKKAQEEGAQYNIPKNYEGVYNFVNSHAWEIESLFFMIKLFLLERTTLEKQLQSEHKYIVNLKMYYYYSEYMRYCITRFVGYNITPNSTNNELLERRMIVIKNLAVEINDRFEELNPIHVPSNENNF